MTMLEVPVRPRDIPACCGIHRAYTRQRGWTGCWCAITVRSCRRL